MLPNRRTLPLVFCLAATLLAHSQSTSTAPPAEPAAPSATREDLVSATRGFFRDSVEFPLLQELTISLSKGSGPLKTINRASLDYVFHGYSTGMKTPMGEMDNIHFKKFFFAWDAMKGALHGDAVAIVPARFILEMTRESTPATAPSFEMTPLEDDSGGWTVRMSPQHECPPLAMTRSKRWNLPDVFCGIADFRLRDDLSIESFTFYSGGLPATIKVDHLGKRALLSYSVEVHFREVLLPDADEPFVIPRSVTTTLETDKGKLVINNDYEPEREIVGERFQRAGR